MNFTYRHTQLSFLILIFCLFNPASAENLLLNPSFETSPISQQWFVYGGEGAVTASSEQAKTGAQSALVTQRSETYIGVGYDILSLVEAGKSYSISAAVRLREAGKQSFQLSIKQVDGDGTQYIAIDSSTVERTGWAKIFGSFTLKPQGNLKSLTLYVHGPAAGIDFFVDDVELSLPTQYIPMPATAKDLIRARGQELIVGEADKVIRLIGSNFVAYSDDLNDPVDWLLQTKNYDEIDFQRVAQMGMNVVRLNMSYVVFVSEDDPFTYTKIGWDWLEKHIIWARKYGVYLLLDLHVPSGGYQSWGYEGPFWKSNSKHRDRTVALWEAIAKRYQNEPVIAGYDLINEPAPKNNQQWADYAQKLVNAIRATGDQHLIVIEEAFTDDNDPFILEGEHLMYDFHIYASEEYVNQLLYTNGFGYGGVYPDPEVSVFPYQMKKGELVTNSAIPTGTTDWAFYEGERHTVTDERVFAALPTLISDNNSGKVWFDDFIIREYHPNGQFNREFMHVNIEKRPSEWYFLDPSAEGAFLSYAEDWKGVRLSGSGKRSVDTSTGHEGEHSVAISNARNGIYGIQNRKMRFPVKQGYAYQISGWMKGKNVSGGRGTFGLQWQKFRNGESPQPFTKDYLEKTLLDTGASYYREHNVPVNVGEFGISIATFLDPSKGGTTLLKDWLDLFSKYKINAQYFNYHGTGYGTFYNVYGFPDVDKSLPEMMNTFFNILSKDDDTFLGIDNPPPVIQPLPTLPNNTPPNTPSPTLPPSESSVCTAVFIPSVDGSPSGTLSLPCVDIGGVLVKLDIQQSFSSQLFIYDINQFQLSNEQDECVARYEVTEPSLHVPCVRAIGSSQLYDVSFFHLSPTQFLLLDPERVYSR